jgi:hypothetical protein
MHAQDFIFDQGGNRHYIEQLNELAPKWYIVPAAALLIKAIYPWYVLALVIAPQQEDTLRILYFEGKQQHHCLNALDAAVDIVTKEQVISFWWLSTIFYKTKQIVILSVNISSDCHWRPQPEKHWLTFNNFLSFFDNLIYYRSWQVYHCTRVWKSNTH